MCASSGLPPHSLGVGGETHGGWDWIDLDMLAGLRELEDERCPDCGRPLAVHEDDSADEYATGRLTCTAARAIARDRADWEASPAGKAAVKDGPEAQGRWIAWRRAEGAPVWHIRETVAGGLTAFPEGRDDG